MLPSRRSISAIAVAGLCGSLFGCAEARPAPRPGSTARSTASIPPKPLMFFFGDSFTHGTAAAPGRGFPHVVAGALGGEAVLGPDNSGAGFVHSYVPAHRLLPEVAADLEPMSVDVVVIQAGVNDQPGPLDGFWSAVERTASILRTKAPGAQLVLVGPAMVDGSVSEALTVIDAQEHDFAAAEAIPYISPLREHWFTTANSEMFMDVASGHPNTAGHAYYGGRIASALLRLQDS